MNWQDRMKSAGWTPHNLYYWQHKDGRTLVRQDNGYWYLSVPLLPERPRSTATISKLGKSMGDAFASVLGMKVKA